MGDDSVKIFVIKWLCWDYKGFEHITINNDGNSSSLSIAAYLSLKVGIRVQTLKGKKEELVLLKNSLTY